MSSVRNRPRPPFDMLDSMWRAWLVLIAICLAGCTSEVTAEMWTCHCSEPPPPPGSEILDPGTRPQNFCAQTSGDAVAHAEANYSCVYPPCTPTCNCTSDDTECDAPVVPP